MAKVILGLVASFLLVACAEEDSAEKSQLRLERAQVYQDQGQYKAANIEYRNALRELDGDVSVVVKYANMLNKVGQHNVALDLLRQTTSGKTVDYYIEVAKAYQGKQKFLSAQKLINENLTGDDIEIQLLRAHNLLGLNEVEDARKAYQAILNVDASNDQAKLGKATALVRLDEWSDAKLILNSITEKDESYSKARILLAGIAISEQDLERAEDILTNLLSVMKNTDVIEPEKANVLERLSYVLTRQGRSNEAYIYTKLLAEAFPGASEVREKYSTAVQSMKDGDLAAAEVVLLDILNDYPSYKAATQLLGVISYLKGDNISASKYLSESVDPEVADDMTRHIYAATNLQMNDPQKVLEILGPNIERSEVPETLALYGIAAISDGQLKKGERALLKALSLNEQNIRIRLVLADFYKNALTADKDKEFEQLNAAYQIDSTDLQVLKGLVSYHLRHDGPNKAEQFISRTLRSQGKDYATNMIAGFFYANQNNLDLALQHFTSATEAVSEGRSYLDALSAKGRAEITLKQGHKAKRTFETIIEVSPDSGVGYRGLLLAYAAEEKAEQGRSRLEFYANQSKQLAPYTVLIQESVSQQDISGAKAYLDKASAAFADDERIKRLSDGIKYVEALEAVRNKNFDIAREKAAEILTSEPDNMRLLSFLVDLELKAGRVNEAEKVLDQIESINRDHLVVTILRGDIALAQEDHAAARRYLQDAWRRLPDNVSAEKLYGVLGVVADRSVQVEFLDDWISKIPNSPQARMHKALAYLEQGDNEKAAEGYEDILKVAPNNIVALNNLGWIYHQQKDPRAMKILEKAVTLAPDNAAVLDSYGWVLVNNDRVSEGIDYLEKAYKLAPDMKEVQEHLEKAKARQ